MTRSGTWSLLVACILAESAGGQTPEVRFARDSSRDDTTAFISIRARLDSLVSAGTMPSVAVAVTRGGRIVWEAAAGFADREHSETIAGYLLAASTTERPRFGLPFYVELRRKGSRPQPATRSTPRDH